MLDKIKALSAPPGHSLTGQPGKWAWEHPPRFANPNDAIDFITDKLEDRIPQEDMVRMLTAGISVEELVNQISFKGFMEGAFNPDVAELIKPAMSMYLLTLALDSGFSPRMFIEEEPEPQVNDERFLSIMKERNPEIFNLMNEEINKNARLEEQRIASEGVMVDQIPQGMLDTTEEVSDDAMDEEPVKEGGFLNPELEGEIE